jgi:hypothetical protein
VAVNGNTTLGNTSADLTKIYTINSPTFDSVYVRSAAGNIASAPAVGATSFTGNLANKTTTADTLFTTTVSNGTFSRVFITVTLVDDATYTLPDAKNYSLELIVSNVSSRGNIRVTSAGVCTVDVYYGTEIVNSDTDVKINVYDGGTAAVLKNRTGGTLTFLLILTGVL